VAPGHDGVEIEGGYRIDLLVEGEVVVELKVVEQILEVHKAQLLSYLKLADKRGGTANQLQRRSSSREYS
jgi:GxxExxY protein